MTRRSCAIYGVGIVCASLLVIGISLTVAQVFQTLIHNRLKKEITLTEGSRVFETWKNPPPPVFMQYFFFNVTNPDDFLVGAKPIVSQVGPYTYREYRAKENVTFVDNGTRVSAYQPKTFVFLPERSVGDPDDDMITTINIPAVAVMNKVKDSFWKSSMVSVWMNSLQVGMFMTRSVNELLWGFKDPLLSRIHPINPEIDEYFGLMYKKNGSNDGEFVYHTGEADFMDYGRVATFKGESKLSLWTSEQSNMINGTDGSAFHPLLSKTERLYIFSPDLCRSIFMEFEKDVKVKGLPAYRFTPPRDVLASKEENPANEGFCVSPKECLGTGLLKVSVCRKGAPVVTSFPHFYLGDEKYSNAIVGLDPVREHHQTYLDLNPTTGVPIRASKRAQINILINRISGFPKTKSLNETIFPVMFINETVVIDDVSAAKLHKLLLMVSLVSNFPLVLVGLGAILLLVFIGLIVCECKQKKSTKEDTSYSPVSNKEADEKNGCSYVALTPVIDKS
ncbi:lysosome membrane protein 2 [Salmo salar]|uniref:Lysosome membrane protein 2 n=1 Tax=Salmo salar TaxID=8030 RepID=A0A1S3LV03_SALSA|nr:lysosome membrane protein 2-like [Salmo salar]|eukprot:XP_013994409.1 PREDICTED: lysosome membrane protein 2-like [Salmo salar]